MAENTPQSSAKPERELHPFLLADKLWAVVLSGALFSMLGGFIFLGKDIFNIHHPGFMFISYGIVASVSFALFIIGRFRDAALMFVLLFILNILIANLRAFSVLLTHFLFFSSVVLATFVYSKIFVFPLSGLKWARPLILAGFMAILFVLDTILLGGLYAAGRSYRLLANLPLGFLLGLGVGVGFEVAEFVLGRGEAISEGK